MVNAVILLQIERTRIRELAETLASYPEVSEVYSVAGKYDLVLVARVHANEDLADLVTGRMAALPGITHTETLIAFRAYSRRDLEGGFSIGG